MSPFDFLYWILSVCLDACRAILNCNRSGHNDINFLCDILKLVKSLFESCYVISADFKTGINEEVGNITVRSKNSCNKAVKIISRVNSVFVTINKSCLICNIVSELITLFDAYYRTLGSCGGVVNKFDESLGFS